MERPRPADDGVTGTHWSRPLTPVSFLDRSAKVFEHRTAVVDGDLRLTYAEFDERADRLAGAVAAFGVEPGDRVALLAPNSHVLLEAHYGVPRAGAVLVALNNRLSPSELRLHRRPLGSAAADRRRDLRGCGFRDRRREPRGRSRRGREWLG